MVLVNLAPASSANFFKPKAVNFHALDDHDKTLFCLLAREAGADCHAIASLAFVDHAEVRALQNQKHAFGVKSVGFGENDHV